MMGRLADNGPTKELCADYRSVLAVSYNPIRAEKYVVSRDPWTEIVKIVRLTSAMMACWLTA
jgi:hypothetical protein